MADYRYIHTIPNGRIYILYGDIFSYEDEYKEDPIIDYNYYAVGVSWLTNPYMNTICNQVSIPGASATYDYRAGISLERIADTGIVEIYASPGLSSGFSSFTAQEAAKARAQDPYEYVTRTGAQLPIDNLAPSDSRIEPTSVDISLATNIPIFETDAELSNYIRTGQGINDAINANIPREKEGEDFSINNVWTHGTWTATGVTGMQGQNFRLVQGRLVLGRIGLYPVPNISDGALKYGIKFSSSIEFDGIQYSIDGINWLDSDTFPFNFFYRERIDELGEFDFGLSMYSNLPIFADEDTAQKWIEEDPSVSLEDATNWPDISGQYPPNNDTGDELGESEFSEVKVKGHFSQQYICDDECLTALAEDLFDTSAAGMWEDFKKGLDAFGASPIEAVMGLSWFPFDAGSIFNAPSSSYIWFGGYGWPVSAGSCKRIVYANGYKSIGSLLIKPFYHSWRDYEPYTKLYVQLPYCGTYQLDLERYWNKTVEVRYYIDTRTNGCIACLIADGYLMDYFNGQMGVTMPITLTDYSAYMNAQMQVLLQGGGQAAQSYGHAANAAAKALPMGLGAGLIAGGTAAGISGAVTGAKTVYGLMQNNINNFNKTKGGSSSMINCYLPQTVDFIFEIQEDAAPNNYGEMFGYPSMKAGSLANFSGFLKCQSVKLQCPTATERERERLKQMLLSGIYI